MNKEVIEKYIIENGRVSIPEIQSKFSLSYKAIRALFFELEEQKKIALDDGIYYKVLANSGEDFPAERESIDEEETENSLNFFAHMRSGNYPHTDAMQRLKKLKEREEIKRRIRETILAQDAAENAEKEFEDEDFAALKIEDDDKDDEIDWSFTDADVKNKTDGFIKDDDDELFGPSLKRLWSRMQAASSCSIPTRAQARSRSRRRSSQEKGIRAATSPISAATTTSWSTSATAPQRARRSSRRPLQTAFRRSSSC